MLDSTISGTSEMARVKDTIFMVGGTREIYEQCVPLFAAMGREWVYMGDNGKGAVVNLVLSLNRMALASEMSKGRGEWDSSGIINFYNELANI